MGPPLLHPSGQYMREMKGIERERVRVGSEVKERKRRERKIEGWREME